MAADVMGGTTYTSLWYSSLLESIVVKLGTQYWDYIQQLFIFFTQIRWSYFLLEGLDQKISAFSTGYLYSRHRLSLQDVFICNWWDGQFLFSYLKIAKTAF